MQAQKAVWQRGLEARILLQRALAGANRLPQVGQLLQRESAAAVGEELLGLAARPPRRWSAASAAGPR